MIIQLQPVIIDLRHLITFRLFNFEWVRTPIQLKNEATFDSLFISY